MRRRFNYFFIAWLWLAIGLGTGNAYALGNATKCIVTVKKILLKSESGDWYTLSTQDYPLDFSEEEVEIKIINKGLIPPGMYVNVKLVISETFVIAGSDGPNLTKEGGEVWVEGTAASISDLPGKITFLKVTSPTWNAEKIGDITVHLNLDYSDSDNVMEIYGKKNFLKPLKVREGSKIQVVPAIFFAKTIRYVWADFWETFPKSDTMYFLPPTRVDELSLRVDGKTAYMSENIEWKF